MPSDLLLKINLELEFQHALHLPCVGFAIPVNCRTHEWYYLHPMN